MECIDCLGFQLDQAMLRGEFLWGNDCCNLYTMLDGLLIEVRNGLGTIPLHVLTTRAELTPKPDYEIEIQNILGCRTRHAKINYPSVGFVSFGYVKKSFERQVCC